MSTRTQTRKERGLCGSCNSPPRPEKTTCQDCADKKNTGEAAKRKAAKEAGICTHAGCHNLVTDGQTRCKKCRKWRTARLKRIREEYIDMGLCARCGNEKETQTKLCDRCKEYSLGVVQKHNFGGNREGVMDRDGHACQLCGRSDPLVVHHINRKKDNATENMIVLCRRCHCDIHRLGNKPSRNLAAALVRYSGKTNNTKGKATMSGWLPLRSKLLDKAMNRCELCGGDQQTLVIHHKDDRGLRNASPNNNPENLIVLCGSCHNAITNQRNNSARSLAASLVIALGPGMQLAPASSRLLPSPQPAARWPR